MPNMDIYEFARNVINQNPQIANNPNNKPLIDAIMSGNSKQCMKVAQDICNANNVLPSQAMNMAWQFFNNH